MVKRWEQWDGKSVEMKGRNQSDRCFWQKESNKEKNNNHKSRRKISWVIVLKLDKSICIIFYVWENIASTF